MSDKEKKTKRSSRTTQRQFNIMVDFISDHKEMISGKLSQKFTAKQRNELWENLTELLNADGLGARKGHLKWRKTWTDFKGEVKCKAADILKHQSATGGGSPTQEYLSPLYEKAANLIGKDLIQGDTTTLVSDRELKINSPKASTSHDAASQDSITADVEKHFRSILDYEEDDLLDTEQQQPQERISPLPTNMSNLEDQTSEAKTSNKTPKSRRSKKKNPYYTTEDVHLMVGAEKDKANAINRLASTIEERNIIEAEKNEILKERNEIET